MTSLVLCEHDNAVLNGVTLRTISAALQLGGPVDVLVAGAGCRSVAEQAASLKGVRRVLLADAEALRYGVAEAVSAVMVAQAGTYDALVAPASANGKNIMPRVAALLDATQVSEVVRIIDAKTFEHPIYAGNALETVRTKDAKVVLTIRTSAFEAAEQGGEAVGIQAVPAEAGARRPVVLDQTLTASDRPELNGARVVVSGGRALGSKAEFERLLGPLADSLGAALGASRAAVDAGYAPNDWQVGQTGKIVAPNIYIAVGISGAIQHVAGMKDAKIVVAINKDADAPIFALADYGLVGDLFELVPDLTRALA